ncbi:MAG: PilN domain-containing protein [Nitrospirota bacterium]|nr:PilN domain-containing protein [Nitrospirota bacterium]
MIKINLLPTKRKPSRKITDLQKQAVLGGLILGGVITGMVLYTASLNQKIAQRQQKRDATKTKIAQQETMLKEVKNVEDEEKKVTEKINVIEQLKKNQQGPVRMLDEISRAVPTGIGITSITEAAGRININGDAFTNEDIVKFVENLKASPFFQEIYLLESMLAKEKETEIYRFKLQMKYKGV